MRPVTDEIPTELSEFTARDCVYSYLATTQLTIYGCSKVSTTLSESCENVIQESYVSVVTTLSGNFERKWGKCCQITLLQRCMLPNNVAATL